METAGNRSETRTLERRIDDRQNLGYNPTTTPATEHRRATARTSRLDRRDELVCRHMHLAGTIARELLTRLPARFELEDLEAAGRLGLLHAAERYRPQKHGGAPFEAFARAWVRGAILSAVRREWSDGDGRHGLKPLTEALPPGEGAATEYDYAGELDAVRRIRTLHAAVETLPIAQRRVLRVVLNGARTVRAAAAVLGIPESRAYRLHNSGIAALRARPPGAPVK